jgi:hypothetical protein
MSLEFEQLTTAVSDMAQETSRRHKQQETELQKALALLESYAREWELINERLDWAITNSDSKFYRSARPLHHELPINMGIDPPQPPRRATIIAADGSQIIPDRHAAFLYYLINVGVITYFHGSGNPPEMASFPQLRYPRESDLEEEDAFSLGSGLVSMRRDLAEIGTLAEMMQNAVDEPGPLLGIVDQRLLYWPIGSGSRQESDQIAIQWQDWMSKIRETGGWLAGFIDRPGKRSVLTMLYTLDLDNAAYALSDLAHFRGGVFSGLTDTDLFDALLKPGQRSVIFTDISQHNREYSGRDRHNEVCFFYLKTGAGQRELARVDVPIWVARDKEALNQVHALLVDQCRIIGSYPYVITRADEIAVVGRRDQEELENRIALRLAELNLHPTSTGKQFSKEIARGGRTRHEG